MPTAGEKIRGLTLPMSTGQKIKFCAIAGARVKAFTMSFVA